MTQVPPMRLSSASPTRAPCCVPLVEQRIDLVTGLIAGQLDHAAIRLADDRQIADAEKQPMLDHARNIGKAPRQPCRIGDRLQRQIEDDIALVGHDGLAVALAQQDRALAETLRLHFAGQSGLVLLAVRSADLGDALIWEASRGGALFPHLYGGPLPCAAIAWEAPLSVAADGSCVLPEAVQ